MQDATSAPGIITDFNAIDGAFQASVGSAVIIDNVSRLIILRTNADW